MTKYNPAAKMIERFPRYPKPSWAIAKGRATLVCGCGQMLFFIQKTGMQRQRHTMKASHRKIIAVCPNPKCRQKLRLD